MDRIDAMQTLLAAVDGGSLSAAARARGMPLATVSRKVSELEDRLRTQLLVRGSRRLTLTEAGRDYVESCRRILDDLQEAERRAAGEYRTPRGTLTITAPLVFGRLHVTPVVLDFLAVTPEVNVRLVLNDQMVNLTEQHIDVAVRIGELPDTRLKALKLGMIGWTTCASPAYLARRGRPAVPDDLAGHDCVSFEGMYSSGVWRYGSGRGEQEITVQPRCSVTTAEAAVDAAVASAGITRVLSYQVAAAIADGRLVPILDGFAPPPRPVHFLFGDQPLLALKLRAFLDFAAPRLRTSLAASVNSLSTVST